MPRRSRLEDRLARVAELRRAGDAEAARPELERFLADKSCFLAAKAAKLAGDLGLDDLTAALVAAFDRFMVDPERIDKGCAAKSAIVRALVDLDALEDEVYLRGVKHRQLEAAYGAPVDTAAELRAVSAEGLLAAGHPDLGVLIADLLADAETPARLAAVRVLAASGRTEAEPLLRLKARLGDPEGEVTGEALAGLLAIAPRRSLGFVAGFLRAGDPAAVEAAALALGESRLEEAVPLLEERYERCFDPRLAQTLLIAISMLRREAGLDFLLSLVKEAGSDRAAQAVVALAIHRGDDAVRERVEATLAGRRDDGGLRRVFEREFD